MMIPPEELGVSKSSIFFNIQPLRFIFSTDDNTMSGIWAKYNAMLEAQPLLTKALTSLTGFTIGDMYVSLLLCKLVMSLLDRPSY